METRSTPLQILLLKAALRKGAAGLQAYADWQSSTRFETIDSSSGWVLPLLYCTLRDQGVSGAQLAKYAYVYRHNWYKNHLFLYQISKILHELQRLEIPLIWLKGAAFATCYYDDPGARPINHFDVWAPVARQSQILACLAEFGWFVRRNDDATTRLEDPFRRTIYLHWQMFGGRADELIRACTISHAADLKPNPLVIQLPHPVDHFIYLCANVGTWDSRSTLLWMADAARIMLRHPLDSHAEIARRTAELGLRVDTASVQAHIHALLPN